MPRLFIAIGCDCDPDRSTGNASTLSFKGLDSAIKEMVRLRRVFTGLKITWFVRCDKQIEAMFGSAEYMYRERRKQWEELRSCGDEIGWHPHMWSLDESKQEWMQETNDLAFQRRCILESFNAIPKALRPRSSHMGWCYMNNTIAKALRDTGISTDCSPIPGHNTMAGGRKADSADWSRTSDTPYTPSDSDYQKGDGRKWKSEAGIDELVLIPASTGRDKVVGWVRFLRERLKRGSLETTNTNDQVPLIYMRRILFKRLFETWLKKQCPTNDSYFLTYFHPDECPKFSDRGNALKIAYSQKGLALNLEYIRKRAAETGRQIEYVTVSELREELRKP